MCLRSIMVKIYVKANNINITVKCRITFSEDPFPVYRTE